MACVFFGVAGVDECHGVPQRPHKASAEEMMRFHTEDYIKFLQNIRPDNARNFASALSKCESSGRASMCWFWRVADRADCVVLSVATQLPSASSQTALFSMGCTSSAKHTLALLLVRAFVGACVCLWWPEGAQPVTCVRWRGATEPWASRYLRELGWGLAPCEKV